MKNYLTPREVQQITQLVLACNKADGTGYTPPLDADAYFLSCHGKVPAAVLAVYTLGDTLEGRPVEELLLFTDPEFRGKHRAGKLLQRYREYRRSKRDGQISAIRFSAYPARNTEAFLEHLGADHSHDELLMQLDLRGIWKIRQPQPEACSHGNAKKSPRRSCKEQEYIRQNRYSECSVKTWKRTGYLYGVRTDESHLRQGSAESLLRETLTELSEKGAETALLQVSSANIPALHLYRKLGFEVTETLQIWDLKQQASE